MNNEDRWEELKKKAQEFISELQKEAPGAYLALRLIDAKGHTLSYAMVKDTPKPDTQT